MSLVMTEREPMSLIDAAWLRMDRPTNLMMICGMMMFADRLDLEDVREVIRTRMLCFRRFTQRAVRDSSPYWETDPYFDLDWHVRHIALPRSGDLEEVVSDLISTPLDPSKPMWQFHVVDTESGSALVMRIHHSYGDGFALTYVLATMTDTEPGNPRNPLGDLGRNDDTRSAWERILGPASEVVSGAYRAAQTLASAGWDLVSEPSRLVQYGEAGLGLARDAAVIAGMTPDSPTRFKGPMGVMKRAAWASPLSLFEVKAVAEAFGCSVNDVLLSCVAGALRAYLLEQGDDVEGVEIRALVPVNQRPPGRVTELGNDFSLVFVSLPVGIEDPIGRMLEMRKRMNELKSSRQPLVAMGILISMGLLPEDMKERVLEALAANASAVITNVRGSAKPQYFAGKRIERQVFWVPQSGGIGMGISILSYAGNVDFGVATDVQRVPDPATLVRRFTDEFEATLLTALLMPWPGEPARTDP